MTTLIDRILSQIIPAFVDYNLRTKKHIIEYGDTPETFQLAEDRLNIEKQLEYNLRQILEAELTAVKGVDELEAQLNQAQNNAEIWTAIWDIYDYLKLTSVAKTKEEEMDELKEENRKVRERRRLGEYADKPTEEIIKDYKLKEVKPIYDAKDPESNRKHIIENMC